MAKTDKTDRRAVIDQMRAKQKSAERRRGFTIVGVCIAVAVLIVGAAAYSPIKNWWDLRQFNGIALEKIGAPANACQKVIKKKGTGVQDHVSVGTDVTYEDSPPAFGQHWDEWDVRFDRKMYTASDRPDVERLVHNLEHGYTILWYDDTIADDNAQLTEIRAIAKKMDGQADNDRTKFKAVPWEKDDGKPFPDGQHIAFTHWSVGGAGESDPEKVQGIWQYCDKVSGDALKDFMLDYPYMDSPEPNVSDRGK